MTYKSVINSHKNFMLLVSRTKNLIKFEPFNEVNKTEGFIVRGNCINDKCRGRNDYKVVNHVNNGEQEDA